MFSGCMVAIVTPFKGDSVDYDKLNELVDFHLAQGTDAIVPCGTTGESPTLNYDEHNRVIQTVIERVARRIPVIAGTGSNSTHEALELTKLAESAGADAALMITPYYNKPTQEGMYQHFKRIAESTNIPIVLYNVPGRTGVSLAPETIARLAEIENIVGIKEASGSTEQVSQIRLACDINIISGDDSMTLPILALGGTGVISVVANFVPRDLKAMIDAFHKADMEEARRLHYKLYPLCKAMFIESNPIPVKTAMRMLGMINGQMRLPLWPMSETNEERLNKVLSDYGFF